MIAHTQAHPCKPFDCLAPQTGLDLDQTVDQRGGERPLLPEPPARIRPGLAEYFFV